jgi:hypothetical protein
VRESHKQLVQGRWASGGDSVPLNERWQRNLSALGCENDLADRTATFQCLEGFLHVSQRKGVAGKQLYVSPRDHVEE